MKPAAGRRQEAADREVLAGPVERVTFHNPENGFCVLRTRARGHRELVTVVGHAATVSPGEWIAASGEWVDCCPSGCSIAYEARRSWKRIEWILVNAAAEMRGSEIRWLRSASRFKRLERLCYGTDLPCARQDGIT